MIRFEDVWLSFDTQQVLRGVSLEASPKSVTVLAGESGSGKSTILRLMMGFLQADSGLILVDGRNVTNLTERQWVGIRGQMGMVFQSSALFDSLTVCQNVGFYPHFVERKPWAKVREEVMNLLDELDLEMHANKMPGELSGGMQRRVALARSLIYRPQILLYDEPTTGLDPTMIGIVNELILEMREKYEVTSVVVTHDMECIHQVADHVVLLVGGEATTVGPPRNLLISDKPAVIEFTRAWREQLQNLKQQLTGVAGLDPGARGESNG